VVCVRGRSFVVPSFTEPPDPATLTEERSKPKVDGDDGSVSSSERRTDLWTWRPQGWEEGGGLPSIFVI
jgi:hypothetical protein